MSISKIGFIVVIFILFAFAGLAYQIKENSSSVYVTIDDFSSIRNFAEGNAARDYYKAAQLNLKRSKKDRRIPSEEQIALIRSGTKLKQCEFYPSILKPTSPLDKLPYLSPLRDIAFQMSKLAEDEALQGHIDKANELLIDQLIFGTHIRNEDDASLIQLAVGYAIQKIAIDRIHRIYDDQSKDVPDIVKKLEPRIIKTYKVDKDLFYKMQKDLDVLVKTLNNNPKILWRHEALSALGNPENFPSVSRKQRIRLFEKARENDPSQEIREMAGWWIRMFQQKK